MPIEPFNGNVQLAVRGRCFIPGIKSALFMTGFLRWMVAQIVDTHTTASLDISYSLFGGLTMDSSLWLG